ncbi:MAG TPA: response regulator [Polyangiaceae bacterium]|jgi:CheY-like chemotaxis protein|nr:response regulator [Polyangiaceae bacterium]
MTATNSSGDNTLGVLIVEDDDDSREMLAELVTMLGCRALRAGNADQALEHAERSAPDLALIDIGLPEVDGYEVARMLRAHPRGGLMRLVALTGYSDASVREEATAAGFDEFVVKPVLPEALEKLLKSERDRTGA